MFDMFDIQPRNAAPTTRRFGYGPIIRGSGGSQAATTPSGGGSGTYLKTVTVHTSGSTIVADLTGATYDDYADYLIEDALAAAFITSTDGTLIYLANVRLSATRTFTANLSATPTVGTVSLHLYFQDLASI